MLKQTLIALSATAALVAALPAQAQDTGNWIDLFHTISSFYNLNETLFGIFMKCNSRRHGTKSIIAGSG